MKSIVLLILSSIFLVSCSSIVRFSDTSSRQSEDASTASGSGLVFRGKASYYHDKFEGRTTASGEIFSNSKMTAAHKTIAFGTRIRVTNLNNGRQVVVVINDRGPFIEGRVIDLSRAAAEALDMIRAGVVDVECEILQ